MPPGGVCGEPCAVFLGAVIPAVQSVAVCRHCLRLQCFVRPADRHLGGNCPNQVFPQRQRYRLSGALIRKANGICCVSRGGSLSAAFFRGDRVRFCCGRCSALHNKRHTGKTVGSTRQRAAQHQQNGAQQQKGTFHTRPPPGTQALGTSYARQRANRQEIRRETPVFLRFAVRSVHLALEFTS